MNELLTLIATTPPRSAEETATWLLLTLCLCFGTILLSK
jgi:hypothetical protein